MTYTIKSYCHGYWSYLKYTSPAGHYEVRRFTSENLARDWAEANYKGSEGVSWAIYEEDEHGVFPTSRSNLLIHETDSMLTSTWRQFKEIISGK